MPEPKYRVSQEAGATVLPVDPASMGRVSAALDRARPMLLVLPNSPLMLLPGACCTPGCPSLLLRLEAAPPEDSRRRGSPLNLICPPGLACRVREDGP